MEFHLSRELLDQIIFGMENQDEDFYVDTQKEELCSSHDITWDEVEEPDERFIPIPDWHSVDGYNLMERFVATLHNPIYRESLRRILSSGKGVFRQFKDALKERKDIERLWYNFKERSMRDVVLDWYNELRESWGLERIGLEIEEDTEQLVLTDFILGPPDEAILEQLQQLDLQAFYDMHRERSTVFCRYMHTVARAADPPLSDRRSFVLVASTPTAETAGFLWSVHDSLSETVVIGRLRQVYVCPEYRGLGLAKTMVTEYLKAAHSEGVGDLICPLHGAGQVLSDVVRQEGGELMEQTFAIDVRHWYVENILTG